MKKSILLLAAILSLSISGCCEKQPVLTGSPTLQTYYVDVTEDKPIKADYEVVYQAK